ncbi:MAG: hypothetical protein ACRC37_00055 [Lentisphaeria bacterium]
MVAIIGILAAIAIPQLGRSRARAQMNSCIAQMKSIASAGQQYMAFEGSTTVTLENIKKEFDGAEIPKCPTNKSADAYQMTGTGHVTCSVMGADTDFPHVLKEGNAPE